MTTREFLCGIETICDLCEITSFLVCSVALHLLPAILLVTIISGDCALYKDFKNSPKQSLLHVFCQQSHNNVGSRKREKNVQDLYTHTEKQKPMCLEKGVLY